MVLHVDASWSYDHVVIYQSREGKMCDWLHILQNICQKLTHTHIHIYSFKKKDDKSNLNRESYIGMHTVN